MEMTFSTTQSPSADAQSKTKRSFTNQTKFIKKTSILFLPNFTASQIRKTWFFLAILMAM